MGHRAETYYCMWEHNGFLLYAHMDKQELEVSCQNSLMMPHWLLGVGGSIANVSMSQRFFFGVLISIINSINTKAPPSIHCSNSSPIKVQNLSSLSVPPASSWSTHFYNIVLPRQGPLYRVNKANQSSIHSSYIGFKINAPIVLHAGKEGENQPGMMYDLKWPCLMTDQKVTIVTLLVEGLRTVSPKLVMVTKTKPTKIIFRNIGKIRV